MSLDEERNVGLLVNWLLEFLSAPPGQAQEDSCLNVGQSAGLNWFGRTDSEKNRNSKAVWKPVQKKDREGAGCFQGRAGSF